MTTALRVVRAGEVDLGCWDSGADGEPVLLMHAAWGSAELWAPQLSSLQNAGYRPIAWSRRGHSGSGTGPADDCGSAAGDLEALADALGLGRFHLVGAALGGFGAVDYALGHAERLISLTLVGSLCGITDADFVQETERLVPSSWETLPIEVRELSAAYRFENPAGTARWLEMTERAVVQRVRQPADHVVTRDLLRRLDVPSLFLTGEADPYMPPPRMAALAGTVPNAVCAVVPGAGHSAPWENSTAFDALLFAFLAEHDNGAGGLAGSARRTRDS